MDFVNQTLEETRVELTQQRSSASQNALEVQRLSGLMEDMRQQLKDGPAKGHRKHLFQTKDLRINPYTGDRAEWKSFATTLLKFIGREAPELRAAMTKVENDESEEGSSSSESEL